MSGSRSTPIIWVLKGTVVEDGESQGKGKHAAKGKQRRGIEPSLEME